MLGGWPSGGIWLSTEPTDMRRSFDGLRALVSSDLGEKPASRRWYVCSSTAAPDPTRSFGPSAETVDAVTHADTG